MYFENSENHKFTKIEVHKSITELILFRKKVVDREIAQGKSNMSCHQSANVAAEQLLWKRAMEIS